MEIHVRFVEVTGVGKGVILELAGPRGAREVGSEEVWCIDFVFAENNLIHAVGGKGAKVEAGMFDPHDIGVVHDAVVDHSTEWLEGEGVGKVKATVRFLHRDLGILVSGKVVECAGEGLNLEREILDAAPTEEPVGVVVGHSFRFKTHHFRCTAPGILLGGTFPDEGDHAVVDGFRLVGSRGATAAVGVVAGLSKVGLNVVPRMAEDVAHAASHQELGVELGVTVRVAFNKFVRWGGCLGVGRSEDFKLRKKRKKLLQVGAGEGVVRWPLGIVRIWWGKVADEGSQVGDRRAGVVARFVAGIEVLDCTVDAGLNNELAELSIVLFPDTGVGLVMSGSFCIVGVVGQFGELRSEGVDGSVQGGDLRIACSNFRPSLVEGLGQFLVGSLPFEDVGGQEMVLGVLRVLGGRWGHQVLGLLGGLLGHRLLGLGGCQVCERRSSNRIEAE